MNNHTSYSVRTGRDSNQQNKQLELDLVIPETLQTKAQKYIDIDFFDVDDIEDLLHLFESCGHRMELKWFVRNIHNWNEHPKTEMGSLLRYADRQARNGIYVLMEKFAQGKSLERLLNPDFFYEQF
ncbi:hypothetical protein [Vibrio lentus]|uniref:Uncharacterized protein n=1 Tax=Vibrio lentus TaxID=136468 RepID=A0A855ITL7_9VIBR|nr:hypothetical protein [Vibrio lentus]PMM59467.1 hypothetical protein BCT50_08550 [Vibrio lentus]